MRTFIAIELAKPLHDQLVTLLDQFPESHDVRWVTHDQLHLSLTFLGEVATDRLDAVRDAAARACAAVAPFEIRIRVLGGFPGRRNPRVLWCGVEDPAAGCRRWVETADPLFAKLGYPPESRAYTPHITLGRSKGPAGGRLFTEVLERTPPPETPAMQVSEVVIFESRLSPKGATYIPQARLPLGG